MAHFKNERKQHFMPRGIPKYVRCYDNEGATIDRFIVVFSHTRDGYTHSVGMSENPFHPQGFCINDVSMSWSDRNKWGFTTPIGRRHPRLGKRIKFRDLPHDCKKVVRETYTSLWRL